MSYAVSVLVLLFSFSALAQVNTYQWQAEDDRTTAEFLFSKTSGQVGTLAGGGGFEQDVNSDDIQVNIKGSFNETFKYRAGLGFRNRQFQDRYDYKVSGLSDFNLSTWGLVPYETFTLNYGIEAHISASPARYEFQDTSGSFENKSTRWKNNFSGYNTTSLFIGSEFIIGKVNAGVRTSFNYYQHRFQESDSSVYYDGSTYNGDLGRDLTGLGADAFAEIPMFQDIRVGIAAGTVSIYGGAEDILFGSADDNLYSQIYGAYDYDKETTFIGAISSKSKDIYYTDESTSLTIGITRAL